MPTQDRIDRALCLIMKEAISDERAASPMYRNLKDSLIKAGVITAHEEAIIDNIIADEINHEKFLVKLAAKKGCIISTKEPIKKFYYELPLSERIKLARGFISKSEKMG